MNAKDGCQQLYLSFLGNPSWMPWTRRENDSRTSDSPSKSLNIVLNLLKSPKIWMGAASVFHPGSSNPIGSSTNIARL